MLKFKTMKKQNTHPTQALSLVSYTRKLTFFTAKFSHSLFLLLFAILFSQISFAQAPYITNATGSGSSGDLVTSVDYLWNASHLESSICQRSGNPPAIAFVYDGTLIGTNAASPEMDAGITIADGSGHSVSERFVNFHYNAFSPSIFRKPDVTLQQDGKKAIVVFETDITEGSMILELNITYLTSSPYITITQGYVLSTLITIAAPLNNINSTNPRIDGDQEYGSNDRFAVVSVQYNTNSLQYEPKYSIYEYDAVNGNYSNINSGSCPNAVNNNSALGTLSYDCINPDIAIGHTGNNVPECVVSYVDGINTGASNTLNVNYIDYLGAVSNVLSYPLPSNIFWNGFDNATKICSENGFNTPFSTTYMRWAMTMSVIDASNIGTSTIPNHLLYVNSNNLTPLYIDDILASAPYLQDKACIDWMENDAAVAWVHEQNVNTPPTQVNQVVAVMNPFINTSTGPPYYYNYWEQVYTTWNTITPSITTVGSPCDIQATSICSDLDLYASGGEYVISEISCGKLYYKLRTINATGYKTNTTKMFNTNLYPVPANDILNITATDIENISVHDIYGHILMHSTLHTGTNSINTSDFPTGNYFLVRNGNSPNNLFSVIH